jgi:hypothetical protein
MLHPKGQKCYHTVNYLVPFVPNFSPVIERCEEFTVKTRVLEEMVNTIQLKI